MRGRWQTESGGPHKPDKGTPLTLDEFRARNDDHIRERLFSRKASPLPQALLADLLADRRLGRVRGPFRPPAKWGAPPFDPQPQGGSNGAQSELLPEPRDEECYPSIAFPINQLGADGKKR